MIELFSYASFKDVPKTVAQHYRANTLNCEWGPCHANTILQTEDAVKLTQLHFAH